MDLIVKPTQACNFSCTFCSSTEIADSSKSMLDPQRIFTFLKRFPQTQNIIVNGGEPLIMGPGYYFTILKHIEAHGYRARLSFTSNLWDFRKHPERWIELFRHPKVGVTTSFQMGESRRISPSQAFTLEHFLEISDLMLEHVGYRPDFISVIDESSAPQALENVRIAKRLDVQCKLNYAMASGRQSRAFPLDRIYGIYYRIWKEGLAPWEYHTKQLLENAAASQALTCPRLRGCDDVIRALNPEGDYYSCGALGDDRHHALDWELEMSSDRVQTPLRDDPELQSLKPECFACEFFELCNGCRKTIRDIKRAGRVAEHCDGMKRQKRELHEMGFAPCT